ncbi:DUF4760 domain-containing protein [Acinetobacter pittii]|uniref:DUF4760 domain-containing protein n=1 Tax=Acinetobacter pittii TaxID=48296 RepID=UPI00301AC6F4
MFKLTESRVAILIAVSAFFVLLIPKVPIIIDFANFNRWTRSDVFVFIQTIVIAISAVIAFMTISASKKTAKERATLDIIIDDYRDTNLFEAKTNIYDFIDNTAEFKSRNNDVSKDALAEICRSHDSDLQTGDKRLKKNLMLVLNRNEFYASAINTGLLDEGLFKRVHCANIVKLWDKLYPTVNQIRQVAKKDTLFMDLEILAARWKANPLKTDDIK